MQELDKSINLLEGFGKIPFGMKMESFIDLMGKPEQEEIISDEGDELKVILLSYPELSTSFFFEGDNDGMFLSSCDSESEEITIFGVEIMDLKISKIVALFEDKGVTEKEHEEEEWGEERISYNEFLIDFYFDNKRLKSVTWGMNHDEGL